MHQATSKAEEIFYAALGHENPGDRSAFLDRVCGDAELKHRVERLLALVPEAGDFLEAPASVPAARDPRPAVEEPGTVIGPYKLLEPIGEGGMGVVYMAEQTTPVRRKVALKIIKPGMDTKQVIVRFEAERQALALMDHPNIAKVHDGGTTEAGRPYFVMELVRGIPITEYCDRKHLSIPERLDLFVLVCRAVQHAHQKGIIHRDLKPSNVLVTLIDGAAVPKVIDFGVAKATGDQLTDKSLFTGFAQLIGTPLYMSPEQADLSGVDVDTRSDIYALGVLLYELLTGTTPIDRDTLCNAAYDEIRRIIREQEPPTPSTRLSMLGAALSTVSADRQVETQKLSHAVRGELDWIVMKALEKDRNRRYETANDFAADVMRHLTDQPVGAGPPSLWYRFSKYFRRNRVALTTAAVVGLALVVGTAMSTWQAVRATRAEQRAKDDFRRARDAVDRIFTQVAEDLSEVPGMEKIRRALLEDALEFYQQFLSAHGDDPEVKHEAARASSRVGSIYLGLGHFDLVEKPVRQAIKLLEDLIAASPTEARFRLDLAECHLTLARSYMESRRGDQDLAERRKALTQYARVVADHPGVPAYLRGLALSHSDLGVALRGSDEAERHFREALKVWEQLRVDFPGVTEDRAGISHAHHWLGSHYMVTHQWPEAERELRRSLALREELLAIGPATPSLKLDLAHIKSYLAELKLDQGKLEESERFSRESIAHVGQLSRDYPNAIDYRRGLASGYRGLGLALWAMGRNQEAEEAFREVVAIRSKLVGEHPGVRPFPENLASICFYLGQLLDDMGRTHESADAFRRSMAIYESLAAEQTAPAQIQAELAWQLAICPAPQFRDEARAVQLAKKALQLEPSGMHWTILGAAQYRKGDWPAAIEALAKAVQLDPADGSAPLFLAMAHWRQGKKDEARSWYVKAVRTINERWSADMLVRRFRSEARALIQIKDFDAMMPNGIGAFAH